MKRCESLLQLSREHHGALVLAKRIERCPPDHAARLALCSEVSARFVAELAPHFDEEEQRVLPLMREAFPEAVQRTLDDHRILRTLIVRIAEQDDSALAEFAQRLAQHVRFEERELFPLYESLLPAPDGGAAALSMRIIS
ncbi:MAG: hemerythrin domain-containing protein [Rhodocyclaceae bacterium]